MKRFVSLLMCLLVAFGLCACKDDEVPTTYNVDKHDFYYSTDNSTFGNERYIFEVGETAFMKLIISISTNKDAKEEIRGSLAIPNITSIDAYYVKGQKITPTVDEINNITTYPFVISTNEEWEFKFEFVPTNVATIQMVLDFEEPIPEMYDSINTLKFVEAVAAE